MDYIIHTESNGDYLAHYGILGMKWGVRRFQKEDGSLTGSGKRRYSTAANRADRAESEARTAHILAKKYTDAADRKAAKRRAQADAADRKYDKRRAQAKGMYSALDQYRASESRTKRFLKDFLLTPANSVTYDMARINGRGRATSWVRSWFDINLSSLTGTVGAAAGTRAGMSIDPKVAGALSTAGAYAGQYGANAIAKRSNKAASLQQISLMDEYDRKHGGYRRNSK